MAEIFASKRVIFGNKKNPKVFLTIPCFWPPYSASPGLDAAAENPSLRGDAAAIRLKKYGRHIYNCHIVTISRNSPIPLKHTSAAPPARPPDRPAPRPARTSAPAKPPELCQPEAPATQPQASGITAAAAAVLVALPREIPRTQPRTVNSPTGCQKAWPRAPRPATTPGSQEKPILACWPAFPQLGRATCAAWAASPPATAQSAAQAACQSAPTPPPAKQLVQYRSRLLEPSDKIVRANNRLEHDRTPRVTQPQTIML